MSLLLAISTASGPASVALARDGEIVAEEASDDPRGHVEFLMPAIGRVCPDLHTLTAIAVDIGPGAFTGLRAGVATAKALAHTLGIPLHPVGGLTALGARVPGAWAVMDAGRGRVYACAPGGEPQGFEPAAAAAAIGDAPVVGDAPYPELSDLTWETRMRVQARDIAAAAERVPPTDDVSAVEPLYLRSPGREIPWEASAAVIQRPDRVKIAGER